MTSPEPLDERYWSEFGFRTPAEVERFREEERIQVQPCVCGHLRREHFLDARGCVHVAVSRSSGGVLRRECPCGAWRDPEARTAIEEASQVVSIQKASENRSGTYTCGGCDGSWGGLSTGHCSGCHHTFTGITAFDKHRTGSHTVVRSCLEPTTVGLVDAGRAYPCWGFPGGDDRWAGSAVTDTENTP